MLLSSSDSVTKRVKNSIDKAFSNEILSDIYWTVTNGTPVPQCGEGKYALTLKQCFDSSSKQVS